MGGHIGAIWRIRFSRPSAAAMWPMSNYFDHFFPLMHKQFTICNGKDNVEQLTSDFKDITEQI